MKHTIAAGLLLCLLSPASIDAQSLGQLSQQEAVRRGAITAPARVLTIDDLTPEPGRLTIARFPSVSETPVAVPPVAVGKPRMAVEPAIYQSGAVPRIPVQAVSAGEVLLEIAVSSTGRVTGVRVLRDTAPFTQEVMIAALGWRFQPAVDVEIPEPGQPVNQATRRAIDSKVLVLGLFRPPALFPQTLGQPPASIASPSDAVPAPLAFPAMPLYPPRALFDGVVLAEQRVGPEGSVLDTRIVHSVPGFDAPALDVLRGLRFTPARVHGLTTPAMVYTVAAFLQPIT